MDKDKNMIHAQEQKKNAVVSWTGGKDGCYSCHRAMAEGYHITHLLHFRSVRKRGSHELNNEVVRAQADAMEIPLIQKDFTSYEEEFKNTVRDLREQGERIDAAVFGHIKTHKPLVDRICGELDLTLLMPLWKRNSKRLLEEMRESGLEIVVVSAKESLMGKEWLGGKIDEKFIDELKRQDSSIDPCGENGEFHTLVTDAPMFKKKIIITGSDRVLQDGYWYLDIFGWTFQEK